MSENGFELSGSLASDTFGELLKDISAHDVSGAFRLAFERQKIVVYISGGKPVLAAANMKSLRLLEFIKRLKAVAPQNLLAINEQTPDSALINILLENNLIDRSGLLFVQTEQIKTIIGAALEWREGEWSFSPLVRAAEGLKLEFDATSLLLTAARKVSGEFAAPRISNEEMFIADADFSRGETLLPLEAFIFSRIENSSTFATIAAASGLPSEQVAKALYALWFGGFVRRAGHRGAFDKEIAERIATTNFRFKSHKKPVETKTETPVSTEDEIKAANAENADLMAKIETLQEFFVRIEVARNHYEILGVERDAAIRDIKTSYFRLAKIYHPDKFHNAENAHHLPRVENAFSLITRAYDALKDDESRKLYDFKLRRAESAGDADVEQTPQTPEDFFRNGAVALQQENFPQAVANFSQAVNLESNNAKYHAFYGKALSVNPKFRHQAESELTNAVRLEPNNVEYRLMLVEFYRGFGLLKRAQGELTRIFTIDPNNTQAREILDSLE